MSTNGGTHPVWHPTGNELFFIGTDQKMMAVAVKGGTTLELGPPQPLFDVRLGRANNWYDVSHDGRFLIPAVVEETTTVPLTVVLNWIAALKK